MPRKVSQVHRRMTLSASNLKFAVGPRTYLVAVHDCVNSMRNCNNGATWEGSPQSLLNDLIRLKIYLGSGFVEL